ncbi:MAG TPA: hypothetical protein VKO16_12700, partial [Polyangia bacterium]|nr:hypothetical protein [Polyangia bacterium]
IFTLAGEDMYIVRGPLAEGATGATAPAATRVPHEPQNAKPGLTMRPQVEQATPSAETSPATGAGAGSPNPEKGTDAAGAVEVTPGVATPVDPPAEAPAPPARWGPEDDGAHGKGAWARPSDPSPAPTRPAPVREGVGVGALGPNWGESFHGIPERGRTAPDVGGGVGALGSPPTPMAVRSGSPPDAAFGRDSPAVTASIGAGSFGAATGAATLLAPDLISLPQPRQNL